MKRRRKQVKRLSAYLRKVEYLHKVGAISCVGVTQLEVSHDNWCQHWQGEACNCEAEVKVRWTQPTASQN